MRGIEPVLSLLLVALLTGSLLFGALPALGPAHAQNRPREASAAPKPAAKPAKPEPGKEVPPPAETPPPPYLAALAKLAETLGALTYLADLCTTPGTGAIWREKMDALLAAEGQDLSIRQRLAGAFNAGFNGYAATYRHCTPSGRAAMEVLLADGARLSRDLNSRFGY